VGLWRGWGTRSGPAAGRSRGSRGRPSRAPHAPGTALPATQISETTKPGLCQQHTDAPTNLRWTQILPLTCNLRSQNTQLF